LWSFSEPSISSWEETRQRSPTNGGEVIRSRTSYSGDHEQIVEVDEIQHFTSDRLSTLRLYPATSDLAFDLDAYVSLCKTWRVKGDGYRSAKPTVDFPHPGGRRAQRAYFDAMRDLAASGLGNGRSSGFRRLNAMATLRTSASEPP
jgi:hypothetical protein